MHCYWSVHCELVLVTARKRSLRQGNMFTSVIPSVRGGESASKEGGLHPGRPASRGFASPLPSDIQDTVNEWRYASYWNAFLFKMCVHCKPMVESVHYLGKWLHLSVRMGLVNLMLTNRHFRNTLRVHTP